MTDWKDTVMSDERIQNALLGAPSPYLGSSAEKWRAEYKAVAQAQAEITGKIMKQEGIKEVVEWIQANQGHIDRWMKKEERVRHYCPNCDNNIIGVYPSEWQAKLKEWGVE